MKYSSLVSRCIIKHFNGILVKRKRKHFKTSQYWFQLNAKIYYHQTYYIIIHDVISMNIINALMLLVVAAVRWRERIRYLPATPDSTTKKTYQIRFIFHTQFFERWRTLDCSISRSKIATRTQKVNVDP